MAISMLLDTSTIYFVYGQKRLASIAAGGQKI